MKKTLAILGLLALTAGGMAWAAPHALSIYINDTPFTGKALWYKDRVYVAVEDLAGSMNGTYSYKPSTGEVRLVLPGGGAAAAPAGAHPAAEAAPNPPAVAAMRNRVAVGRSPLRPYVRAVRQQKFLFPDNAKVVATFKNMGEADAHNVEVVCVFHDIDNRPINADIKFLGDMAPGETRTAEFYMYASSGYASAGGAASSNYYSYGYGYAGFGVMDDDKISIRGQLSTVSYDFTFNYDHAPNPKGRNTDEQYGRE
jgi:hypothetical protein